MSSRFSAPPKAVTTAVQRVMMKTVEKRMIGIVRMMASRGFGAGTAWWENFLDLVGWFWDWRWRWVSKMRIKAFFYVFSIRFAVHQLLAKGGGNEGGFFFKSADGFHSELPKTTSHHNASERLPRGRGRAFIFFNKGKASHTTSYVSANRTRGSEIQPVCYPEGSSRVWKIIAESLLVQYYD